jgi:hypothetical protein
MRNTQHHSHSDYSHHSPRRTQVQSVTMIGLPPVHRAAANTTGSSR